MSGGGDDHISSAKTSVPPARNRRPARLIASRGVPSAWEEPIQTTRSTSGPAYSLAEHNSKMTLPMRTFCDATRRARSRKYGLISMAVISRSVCSASASANVPGPQPISMAERGRELSASATRRFICSTERGLACDSVACAAAESCCGVMEFMGEHNVEVTGAARLYRAASVWTAGLGLGHQRKRLEAGESCAGTECGAWWPLI